MRESVIEKAVCDYAEAHAVDLIVIGSHGRGGMERWLIGSVAETTASMMSGAMKMPRPAAMPMANDMIDWRATPAIRPTMMKAMAMIAAIGHDMDLLRRWTEALREAEAGGVANDGSRPEIVLPMAKGTIASYLGTVHETLSRTFARLIKEKIVAVDGRRVTILDEDGLKRLV